MEKKELEKDIDLKEVLRFAAEKHKGQKRDNGDDYIVHPIRVAKIVDKYKGIRSSHREVLLAASLLHDTLEDTYTSYRELKDNFGEYVASLVVELTTAGFACHYIGKAQYLAEKMKNMTNYALTIKLADRLDNVCDLNNSTIEKKEKTINDTHFILKYLENNRQFTNAQTLIANEIKTQLERLESKSLK